jgi:ornithine decarboxylase
MVRYWIDDSLYGSFNCIIYDQQQPKYGYLRAGRGDRDDSEDAGVRSVVYGATCDSFDKLGEAMLPDLQVGDFLIFENFGAYTLAGACNFNGIQMSDPKVFYL